MGEFISNLNALKRAILKQLIGDLWKFIHKHGIGMLKSQIKMRVRVFGLLRVFHNAIKGLSGKLIHFRKKEKL